MLLSIDLIWHNCNSNYLDFKKAKQKGLVMKSTMLLFVMATEFSVRMVIPR